MRGVDKGRQRTTDVERKPDASINFPRGFPRSSAQPTRGRRYLPPAAMSRSYVVDHMDACTNQLVLQVMPTTSDGDCCNQRPGVPPQTHSTDSGQGRSNAFIGITQDQTGSEHPPDRYLYVFYRMSHFFLVLTSTLDTQGRHGELPIREALTGENPTRHSSPNVRDPVERYTALPAGSTLCDFGLRSHAPIIPRKIPRFSPCPHPYAAGV